MTHHNDRQQPLRTVAACAAAAGILLLAGCGGGSGDGGSSSGSAANGGTIGSTIPVSALQSSDGFIAYVKQVVADRFDTSEPIGLGDVVAPTSNTTEAVGI